MKDLSALAKNSLAPTSQQAGNQVFANNAHTAPGGASGDLGGEPGAPVVSSAPVIEEQPSLAPGTDGKPQARGQSWTPPGPPRWTSTSSPEIVREA